MAVDLIIITTQHPQLEAHMSRFYLNTALSSILNFGIPAVVTHATYQTK